MKKITKDDVNPLIGKLRRGLFCKTQTSDRVQFVFPDTPREDVGAMFIEETYHPRNTINRGNKFEGLGLLTEQGLYFVWKTGAGLNYNCIERTGYEEPGGINYITLEQVLESENDIIVEYRTASDGNKEYRRNKKELGLK